MRTIKDVRSFWESHPLWSGESNFEPGTPAFFEEHRQVVVEDGYVGALDPRMFPAGDGRRKVLDLGCGPGLWTVEFWKRGCADLTAVDLTRNALDLARTRCRLYGVRCRFGQQNAERLAFRGGMFSHVNCQGVIHHTPDTEACVREIARVLAPEGTASISVYYRNALVRGWPWLHGIGKVLARMGAGLAGRGREGIFTIGNVDDLVRHYDGKDNPIGKAYARSQFVRMLTPFFRIEKLFLHFFPARSLPFRIPRRVHRVLDGALGFLIYASVRKR